MRCSFIRQYLEVCMYVYGSERRIAFLHVVINSPEIFSIATTVDSRLCNLTLGAIYDVWTLDIVKTWIDLENIITHCSGVKHWTKI